MTPQDLLKLNETLAYYDQIGSLGRAKIQRFLDSLLDQRWRKDILDIVVRAEEPGYFWQSGWKIAARAWLLAKLIEDKAPGPYLINGDWQPPAKPVVDAWVLKLQTTYEDQLRREITECFSFARDLKGLAALMNSPSRGLWDVGKFSDPVHHNPLHFRYIVYSMVASVNMPFVVPGPDPRSDYLKNSLNGYLNQVGLGYQLNCAQYYLEHPTVLHAELLSCSLISNEFPRTYRDSPFGFILRAPKQNICFAKASDAALSNAEGRADALVGKSHSERLTVVSSAMETLVGMYEANLDSPDKILLDSRGGNHNELGIVGSISGLKVQPSAIFVKVTPDAYLWQSFVQTATANNLLPVLTQCATTLGIPIVAIPDRRGAASAVDFTAWFPNGKI
ncbi:MAG: hypothetical protein GC160_20535 [Acidobacteria bacterium]|nr:hypothetical protein [Acidobacteriota bacterium]